MLFQSFSLIQYRILIPRANGVRPDTVHSPFSREAFGHVRDSGFADVIWELWLGVIDAEGGDGGDQGDCRSRRGFGGI